MVKIKTAAGLKLGRAFALRSDRFGSHAVLAVAASLLFFGPTAAMATITVGGQVQNPGTGALETVVKDLGSGWALTAVTVGSIVHYNAILVDPPAVNTTYTSGGVTYQVVSYIRNATTNLITGINVVDQTDSAHPTSVVDAFKPNILDNSTAAGTAGNGGSSTNSDGAVYVNRQVGTQGSGGSNGYGVHLDLGILGSVTIGYDGSNGQPGGTGPTVNVTLVNGVNGPYGNNANDKPAVSVVSIGGNGGTGGDAYGALGPYDGGAAGAGGTVTLNNSVNLTTGGDRSPGIFALSKGGTGGQGGDGYILSPSGAGGPATTGGAVTVINNGHIITTGQKSPGIFAQSIGGGGGASGDSFGIVGQPGSATSGGNGGIVTVTNSGVIETSKLESHGIWAQSVGGSGGSVGDSGGIVALSGKLGGGGGTGSTVTVNNNLGGDITTRGVGAYGILAQSIGGGGGAAGDVDGLVAIGGTGAAGGDAGSVIVNNAVGTTITTYGGTNPAAKNVGADAIVAQSIGGGGGSGSNGGGLVAIGGDGSAGGIGGSVTVNNDGTLITIGPKARGIFAQSIGGGGGNGGDSDGAVTIGGSGSATSNGGIVTVNNTGRITTVGTAIQAESIGGGGGDGGSAGGLFSIGGSGGGGGDGLKVTVNSSGVLTTTGRDAVGILAQSLGGGGGNGGGSYTGSSSLAIAIGGAGAKGGNAGEVEVNHVPVAGDLSGLAISNITTWGDKAYGILAQSVGGGGGRGGLAVAVAVAGSSAANLSVALGGKGGPGGNSDDVVVNYNGAITTHGTSAIGIFAQSVGGGGGDGGGAVAVGAGGAFNFGLSMGAKGGAAGDAQTVTVNAEGSIETFGLQAYGILAQSVGGGGGNGGFAGAGTLGPVGLSVSLGGDGGGGGKAEAVTVNNDATITTHSDGAIGILAQSLGGGGGNGGFSVSGALGIGAFSAAVGGDGAGGSKGGTVTVDNQGNIITWGTKAYGIYAQSVGGGGGNGGSAVAVSAAISPDPANVPTIGVAIAVGGSGGTANIGDTVHVVNGGSIETHGTEAHGIWAQSVGGGGGIGGFAAAGSAAIGPGGSLTVAVGGTGGTGGNGGAVIVDAGKDALGAIVADSLITTYGTGANGIRAQSIGGGGGDGGFAVGVNVGINNSELLNMNIGVAVGGSGGVAGDGSTVTVNNWAGIRTYGDNAAGIYAQSAGGGGGDGGNAITAVAGWANASSSSAQTVNMSVAVGGKGNAAGDGKDVTVNNYGRIETGNNTGTVDAEGNPVITGNNAYGIFAQSIGGGGGIGGRANSINVLVGKGDAPPDALTNIAMSIAVGGNGGAAGNGGVVRVTNSGEIITNASLSDGIYAQSVGGGGGAGGNGILGTGELIPVPAALIANVLFGKTKIYSALGVAVGGESGSTGIGGLVDVTNTGNITTRGSNSNGIFAQSIGGGGGVGGKANIGATGTLGIGGTGGSGGDGGIVNVHNNGNGVIETFGAASNGIYAQSVGGGGGVAGNVDRVLEQAMGPIPALNLGIGLAFGQGGGSGGSGKDVTVDGNGAIITHGSSSAGIFAQSVGGGGGVLGTLGNDVPVLGTITSYHVGSNGDVGDSGIVHVNYSGTIDTYGTGSIGIFAQSAGGKQDLTRLYQGIAGNVLVDLNGSVVTHAAGTSAIVAQSKAVEGNGNIAINLSSSTGLVQGGATDANHIGVGIWVLDGNNNTVTNRGTVTTASGTAGGWAILSGAGNETVANYGTVTGSFDLGAGANSFTNKVGAVFNAGTDAKVGAGNLFADSGYFSPGGDGKVMTTNLVGNWNQSSTGTYKVDLDLFQTGIAGKEADKVAVTGSSDLAGTAALRILNPGNIVPGQHSVTIATASNGFSGTTATALNLVAPQSAVASFALAFPDSNTINLGYNVNFAPAALSSNERSFGAYVNEVLSLAPRPPAGPTGPLTPLFAALFSLPDNKALAAAYDVLTPTVFADNKITSLTASQDFANALLSCRMRDGNERFAAEGNCAWARITNRGMQRWSNDGVRGFSERAEGLSMGIQHDVAPHWFVGLGLAHEMSRLNVDGGDTSSSGTMTQGGAVLKGVFGGSVLALSGNFGYGAFDTTRRLQLPSILQTLKGKQELEFGAVHVRASHTFEWASGYFKPAVDFGATHVALGAFTETGSAFAMTVSADRQTFLTLAPSLEFGGEIKAGGDFLIRPYARFGVTQYLTNPSISITSAFEQGPTGPTFRVTDTLSRTFGEATLGIDFLGKTGVVLHADSVVQVSKDILSYGGNLKLSVPIN
jgi:hypothetical protein